MEISFEEGLADELTDRGVGPEEVEYEWAWDDDPDGPLDDDDGDGSEDEVSNLYSRLALVDMNLRVGGRLFNQLSVMGSGNDHFLSILN